VFAENLTTVVGRAFDEQGRPYVLEDTTGNPFPTPSTGRVLRHNLYVSNVGFGPPPVGLGQVLEIRIGDDWV
jgi:hypothetical protein